jgi:hypothetical protein
LTTAQQGDLEQAKTHLPEIDQPTGLGSDEVTDKKAIESELKEENSPEIQTPKDSKKQEVKTEHKTPEGKSPAEKVKTPSNEALKQPGALGSAIQNIPEVDPSISTNAGSRPQVELTGDADPRHNQTAQNEANTSTQEASSKARTETEKDFKEGEILPEVEKETMKVQQALTAPEGWNAQGGAVLPELDAQSAALYSGIMQPAHRLPRSGTSLETSTFPPTSTAGRTSTSAADALACAATTASSRPFLVHACWNLRILDKARCHA